MNLKKFQELKDIVEENRRKADRAAGAKEQLFNELKVEFGVDNVDEANRMMDRLEKEKVKLQKEYTIALEEFKSKWDSKLSETR